MLDFSVVAVQLLFASDTQGSMESPNLEFEYGDTDNFTAELSGGTRTRAHTHTHTHTHTHRSRDEQTLKLGEQNLVEAAQELRSVQP